MKISEIMEEVNLVDLNTAIGNVLDDIVGIDELYPVQIELLSALVQKNNTFLHQVPTRVKLCHVSCSL